MFSSAANNSRLELTPSVVASNTDPPKTLDLIQQTVADPDDGKRGRGVASAVKSEGRANPPVGSKAESVLAIVCRNSA